MEMIAQGLVYRPTVMRVPLHVVSYLGYGSRPCGVLFRLWFPWVVSIR